MAIIQNRTGNSKEYDDNFDSIFGTKEERAERRAKEKEAFEELEQVTNRSANVHTFEPFVSPIDGKMVNSKSELAAHNKRHQVTDCRDYSQEHYDRKTEQRHREMLGNTAEAKRERQQLIEKQLYKHGILR